MSRVIEIDGGIGRILCSTGCFTNSNDIIITPWPDVFEYHTGIDKQYPASNAWLYEDVIKNNHFLKVEPYHDLEYREQRRHLSQSFNYLLNGIDEPAFPKIFLTPHEVAFGKLLVENVKTRLNTPILIAYQPVGAGMDKGHDPTDRSLSLDTTQKLVNSIIKENQEIGFLNCALCDIDHPKVWNQELNLRQLFSVVLACDLILAVDSCISHIGAAFNKRGVILLGGTYADNVGWPNYLHIYKEGFPKGYHPNRFNGFKALNGGAMAFSDGETTKIAELVSSFGANPDYSVKGLAKKHQLNIKSKPFLGDQLMATSVG